LAWRTRLVQWLRNISIHFKLRPTALAEAVVLAGACCEVAVVAFVAT